MESVLEKQVEEKQKLVEALERRNARLAEELVASRAREEALWKKIELMRMEERKLEEAEERLCVQLGQLEAEYMEQRRVHKVEVDGLKALLGGASSSGASGEIWEAGAGRSHRTHPLEAMNPWKTVLVGK